MRSVLKVILLPALALAFAGCGDEATPDGGGTTGSTGGQDSGMPDSGGGGCTPACASPLVCNTATNQCTCPSGAPPCGTACCANNFTCATNPFQCVCKLTYCGSDCINTINDPMNCGGCNKVCDGGVTCSNYACNYPIPDSGPIPENGPRPDSGPMADGGPPGTGKPCDPTLSGTTQDSCSPYHLLCDNNFLNLLPDSGSTCQLGTEYYTPCDMTVGCASPMRCLTFAISTGNANFCVYPCATAADCPPITENCQVYPGQNQPVCLTVSCGPGSNPPNGAAFFGPCNNGGTNNGTCLPIQPTQSGAADTGNCAQNGAVGVPGSCTSLRDGDGGTSQLCSPGNVCVYWPKTDLQGVRSQPAACTPLCDPNGSGVPGSTCPTTDTWSCFSFSNPNTPGGFDYGPCLQICDANAGGITNDAGGTCPPPLLCSPLTVTTGSADLCIP